MEPRGNHRGIRPGFRKAFDSTTRHLVPGARALFPTLAGGLRIGTPGDVSVTRLFVVPVLGALLAPVLLGRSRGARALTVSLGGRSMAVGRSAPRGFLTDNVVATLG